MVQTRCMAKIESEVCRSWHRLHNEVQDMILHTILLDARANKHAANDLAPGATPCHNISFLATVCLEWKEFFERNTFKQLILGDSDLPVFQEVVERNPVRLAYVHHVLLHIQLPEYNCDDCKKEEDPNTINRHHEIFSTSIRHLLKILSLWKPKTRGYIRRFSQGLNLEIAISSPSDNQHMFFARRLEQNFPFRTADDLNKPNPMPTYQDSKANRDSNRIGGHTGNSRERQRGAGRLYGTPLMLRSLLPILPKALIVTGLHLPSYTYRNIEVKSLARILRQSLVALKWIRFERCRAIKFIDEERFIDDCTKTLIPSLPSSLEQLHLGQRFISVHHRSPKTVAFKEEELAKAMVSSRIGRRKLSRFSTGSQMSATALLDGLQSHRFESGDDQVATISTAPRYRWSNLRQLCLKSRTFSMSDTGAIRHLLQLAVGAVPSIPKLQVMEIWGSCPEGIAHLFQYKIEQRQPTITWRCSKKQQLHLSRHVIDHWIRVIDHVHPELRSLEVIERTFEESAKEIQVSGGRFINKHLALRRLIFDAVTFTQFEVAEISNAMRLINLITKGVPTRGETW